MSEKTYRSSCEGYRTTVDVEVPNCTLGELAGRIAALIECHGEAARFEQRAEETEHNIEICSSLDRPATEEEIAAYERERAEAAETRRRLLLAEAVALLPPDAARAVKEALVP